MSIRNRTQNTVWEVPQRRSKFFWKTLHLFHKQNLFCKISCIQYVFTPSLFFSIGLFIGDTGWRHALFFRLLCSPPVCPVLTTRMLGVHDPYARCSPHVCPVLGRHLHRDRKSTTAFTLYRRWTKQWSKKVKPMEGAENIQKRHSYEKNSMMKW